jgi:hypothetical protein
MFSLERKHVVKRDLFAALKALGVETLEDQVQRLARRGRRDNAALIARLVVLEDLGVHLERGCSSMFVYCMRILNFSAGEAYNRMAAVHAARRFPIILRMLACGDLHMTAVRLLGPRLTPENHMDVLAEARHRTQPEIEQIVARLRPLPPVPERVRKIPARPKAAPALLEVAAAPPRMEMARVAPRATVRCVTKGTLRTMGAVRTSCARGTRRTVAGAVGSRGLGLTARGGPRRRRCGA